LILANYLVILFSVIFRVITPFALAPLLTLPLAFGAMKILKVNYDKIAELIPAQAKTVQTHLFTGLLLSLGLVVGRVV